MERDRNDTEPILRGGSLRGPLRIGGQIRDRLKEMLRAQINALRPCAIQKRLLAVRGDKAIRPAAFARICPAPNAKLAAFDHCRHARDAAA